MDLNSLFHALRKTQGDAVQSWNVMVVPQSANAVPQTFDVTRWRIQAVAGSVLAVFAVLVIALAVSFRTVQERHRAEVESLEQQLNQSRAAWDEHIKEADAELEQVREEMRPILETENKLRGIAGLQPRYRTENEPVGGQGGLEHSGHSLDELAPEIEEEYLEEQNSDLPPIPEWSAAPVDKLISEFDALNASYASIEQALQEESDRLDHTPLINPLTVPEAWISSGYGYRTDPFTGNRRFHDGIDIVAPRGTEIMAPAYGTVDFAGWKGGLGKMVEIDHGFGYKTRYAHCDRIAVKKGDQVKRGDVIAYLGSTGRSTGPHLHYELYVNGKQTNPYKYIIE